jgi:hypothetical protein
MYALGRDLTYNEIELLRDEGVKLADDGYRMQDLLRWFIHSGLFQEK